MDHPCTKECLKYAICIHRTSIECYELRQYYMDQLKNRRLHQTPNEDMWDHIEICEVIRERLPSVRVIPPTTNESIKC